MKHDLKIFLEQCHCSVTVCDVENCFCTKFLNNEEYDKQ